MLKEKLKMTVDAIVRSLKSIGARRGTNFEGHRAFRCSLAPMILHDSSLIHSSKPISIQQAEFPVLGTHYWPA
jgi:hypothetical protein